MLIKSADEISHIGPRQVGSIRVKPEEVQGLPAELPRLGIGLDANVLEEMYSAYRSGAPILNGMGMDAALTSAITTPSINTPIQFLQHWFYFPDIQLPIFQDQHKLQNSNRLGVVPK